MLCYQHLLRVIYHSTEYTRHAPALRWTTQAIVAVLYFYNRYYSAVQILQLRL